MTDTALPAPPTNDTTTRNPTPIWLLVVAFALVAVLAGAAGAGLTRVAFPPEAGPAGGTGPAGPAGADGTSATLDTNKVGYCFDSEYQFNENVNWIESVNLYAPTSTNGTLSCPSGSFIPLTPTGPNGMPIKNYDASKQ